MGQGASAWRRLGSRQRPAHRRHTRRDRPLGLSATSFRPYAVVFANAVCHSGSTRRHNQQETPIPPPVTVTLPANARRILVFGQSGSGKTTLGRAIGAALGVPHIELDSLYHQPNWVPTPDDEFVATVAALLDAHPDGWVVEGNYKVIRQVTLPRADAIVRLRLPFRTVYPRLVWRTLSRSWRRQELWNGNRESFRLAFTSRESILLWGISHWRAHARSLDAALREIPHTAPVIELRSSKDVDVFLGSLRQPNPTRGP